MAANSQESRGPPKCFRLELRKMDEEDFRQGHSNCRATESNISEKPIDCLID